MRPILGPRASVLLGLLDGQPSTVGELHRRARQILDLDIPGDESDPRAVDALKEIEEGGRAEVYRLLRRLERHGLVTRASAGAFTHLWWTT